MDRERLLDMEQRLKPVRVVAFGVLAAALLFAAPWLGWWTLAPLAFAGGLFVLADRRLPEAKRPEYLMFAAWAGSELTIAIAVGIAGGPQGATLAWLAIPVVTLSARFSLRGVVLGVVIALSLLVGAAFWEDTAHVLEEPLVVTAPAALILSVAILSTPLMRSDLDHRGEAVIDPLTGMLNRKALSNRVSELTQQSEVTGQPIALVIGDLDHFKGINDSLGHAVGDQVLKQIAYEMRRHLRAFDLAYRLGGDEFLFLLPGAEVREGRSLADQLRRAVEKTLGESVNVTISFGVSASTKGQTFDYDVVFAAADGALYEAKQAGRNRVESGHVITGEEVEVAPELKAAFAD